MAERTRGMGRGLAALLPPESQRHPDNDALCSLADDQLDEPLDAGL